MFAFDPYMHEMHTLVVSATGGSKHSVTIYGTLLIWQTFCSTLHIHCIIYSYQPSALIGIITSVFNVRKIKCFLP